MSKPLKRGTPVIVKWRDAHGGDEGWLSTVGKHHTRGCKVLTVGVLLKDSKHGLTIALSTSNSNLWSAYIFIPHVNITSIKRVTIP